MEGRRNLEEGTAKWRNAAWVVEFTGSHGSFPSCYGRTSVDWALGKRSRRRGPQGGIWGEAG